MPPTSVAAFSSRSSALRGRALASTLLWLVYLIASMAHQATHMASRGTPLAHATAVDARGSAPDHAPYHDDDDDEGPCLDCQLLVFAGLSLAAEAPAAAVIRVAAAWQPAPSARRPARAPVTLLPLTHGSRAPPSAA